MPSSYIPVSAIMSTRWFCPGTNGCAAGADAVFEAEIGAVLGDPLRPLRPVLDIGHALLELAACLGDEQVGRHPRHVEMAIGRDSAVLHVVFPAPGCRRVCEHCTPSKPRIRGKGACQTRLFCARDMNAMQPAACANTQNMLYINSSQLKVVTNAFYHLRSLRRAVSAARDKLRSDGAANGRGRKCSSLHLPLRPAMAASRGINSSNAPRIGQRNGPGPLRPDGRRSRRRPRPRRDPRLAHPASAPCRRAAVPARAAIIRLPAPANSR